jgi:S1-C subfamily serine protease
VTLIPPDYLDCVVAIGFPIDDETEYVASGFFYARFLKEADGVRLYSHWLVTNRHVLENEVSGSVRLNPDRAQPARELRLELLDPNDEPLWTAHPDPEVDIAVIPLSLDTIRKAEIQLSKFVDEQALEMTEASSQGVSEGDSVFTLGFPMGLIGEQRNYVIVRQGAIARIRDALAGNSKEFLVDTTVFPGNSGGPVVTRPEFVHIEGTEAPHQAARLIGVVASSVQYEDVAISLQTGEPRVVFSENTGLAAVVPVDYVNEAIDAAVEKAG